MFFLSKLLPQFGYPLGLTTLLLAIALGVAPRRPKLAQGLTAAGLGILWLSSSPLVSRALIDSLESPYRPAARAEALPKASAIVVLGGGVKSSRGPSGRPEVGEAGDRVLYGAQLWRLGKAPTLILSGGRITWKAGVFRPSEADDMATLLREEGVPQAALKLDHASLNTRENALEVRKLLGPDPQPVLLVTSATHMTRALATFKKVGIPAIAAPTDWQRNWRDTAEPSLENLLLDLLPDAEALTDTTRCLKEYFGLWTYRLRGWS